MEAECLLMCLVVVYCLLPEKGDAEKNREMIAHVGILIKSPRP